MGNGGSDFAKSRVGEVCENCGGYLASDVGKSVSVEKQKWGAPVTVAKEF
jgi:hypothetical protein